MRSKDAHKELAQTSLKGHKHTNSIDFFKCKLGEVTEFAILKTNST